MPKKSKRPNMRQIAQELGVSRTTVSMSLKNDPRISPETCKRVQEHAKKRGYTPDPKVARLMSYLQCQRNTKASETIGYLTPFSSRDEWWKITTFREFYQGANERAEELGYRLDTFSMAAEGATEQNINRTLFNRGIRGLIIAPGFVPHAQLELDWPKYASVSIGFSFDKPETHRVSCNHYASAGLALRKLQAYGYKRIGFFLKPDNDERTRKLWQSAYLVYRNSIPKKHQIPEFIGELDEAAFSSWFLKHKPDALLGDRLKGADILENVGLQQPSDFGFALLDAENYPDCAGIAQNAKQVGECATNQLAGALMRNEFGLPEHPQLLMINGGWKDGQTLREIGSSDLSK